MSIKWFFYRYFVLILLGLEELENFQSCKICVRLFSRRMVKKVATHFLHDPNNCEKLLSFCSDFSDVKIGLPTNIGGIKGLRTWGQNKKRSMNCFYKASRILAEMLLISSISPSLGRHGNRSGSPSHRGMRWRWKWKTV